MLFEICQYLTNQLYQYLFLNTTETYVIYIYMVSSFKCKNSCRQRATAVTSSAGMFCLSEFSALAWRERSGLCRVEVNATVRLETSWRWVVFSVCFAQELCVGYAQTVNLEEK